MVSLAQRGPGLASRQREPISLALSGWPAGNAQRGPGLASRQRPVTSQPTLRATRTRSTRAGTRVPATADAADAGHADAVRSTRAGTRVPATGQRRIGRRLEAVRSTRAGTRVPATESEHLNAVREGGLAQRGPGLASRQRQRPPVLISAPTVARSTRAGTRVPATARE